MRAPALMPLARRAGGAAGPLRRGCAAPRHRQRQAGADARSSSPARWRRACAGSAPTGSSSSRCTGDRRGGRPRRHPPGARGHHRRRQGAGGRRWRATRCGRGGARRGRALRGDADCRAGAGGGRIRWRPRPRRRASGASPIRSSAAARPGAGRRSPPTRRRRRGRRGSRATRRPASRGAARRAPSRRTPTAWCWSRCSRRGAGALNLAAAARPPAGRRTGSAAPRGGAAEPADWPPFAATRLYLAGDSPIRGMTSGAQKRYGAGAGRACLRRLKSTCRGLPGGGADGLVRDGHDEYAEDLQRPFRARRAAVHAPARSRLPLLVREPHPRLRHARIRHADPCADHGDHRRDRRGQDDAAAPPAAHACPRSSPSG